ncbi:RNA-directed DNA polymerase, eukaryota [Tanacetum coccineum]
MDVDFGLHVFDVWLKEADIENVVLRGWNKEVKSKRPYCHFRDKLKNIKVELKEWSRKRFVGLNEKINEYSKEAMRWELEAEEGKGLHAKTKIKRRWDIDGDENSKFFHSFVKRRNNKNNIRGLMVDGLWYEDLDTIKEETCRFYKTIFSEQVVSRPQLSCNGLAQVSSIDANMLENPFEEKEDRKEISRGCNSSFMALIPKVADPIGLSEYRPISLIGGYYKIIAKILAERIKLVIGKLVGEVQNAFIGERFILNGILIANETVDFVKKNKSKGLIFKVDFEKAYDSINWRYLCNILKSMGFGEKWVTWIEACLESSSMSVLVNGSLTVEFGLERDVRQGDPLSPFLFILAAEGLNSMIKEAVDKGIFKGINVGFERVVVVSGLRVNLNKSILYGVGVNSSEVSNMASWMQCSVSEFPFTYLGLPIGDCMRRESAWRNVVENSKKIIIVGSKKDVLSSYGVGGRLIKSIYGVSGGLEVDGVGSRVGRSGLWCDIVKEDRWVGDIRLRERFPRLFQLDRRNCVRRLEWLIEGGGMRGSRGGNGIGEDGNFNVKDLAFMVYDICLHVGNTTQKTLWNKLAPKKVNVFIWRVLHGRISVRVELDKRGIELDSILCPCCDDSLESYDHCLVTCNVAKTVWDRIFEWWKISPINVFLANDLFRFSGNVDVERYSRDLWQLLRALTKFRGDQRNLPSIGINGSSIRQAAEFSDGTVKLFVTCALWYQIHVRISVEVYGSSRNKVLVANPLPKKSPYGIKGGRPRVKKGEQRTKVFP